MSDLIKSRYADPAFDGKGFINHIHHVVKDMGVIPNTTIPLVEAYKVELIQRPSAPAGTGGKPRNIAVFRKIVGGDPSDGAWQLLEMWEEMRDYDESSAAGSVDVDPISGTVHVVMSFGKKLPSGAVQYQPWEAAIERRSFGAPPIVRPPSSGAPGPPGSAGPAGAGGIKFFDAPFTTPAWEGRALTAGVLVDIPATFGCPSYTAYLTRFIVVAPQANVRARAGTQAVPHLVTVNTQVANVEKHEQRLIPGPSVWISPAQGSPTVWLQIVGFSG